METEAPEVPEAPEVSVDPEVSVGPAETAVPGGNGGNGGDGGQEETVDPADRGGDGGSIDNSGSDQAILGRQSMQLKQVTVILPILILHLRFLTRSDTMV